MATRAALLAMVGGGAPTVVAAQVPAFDPLPITAQALPPQLRSTRGPAMRLITDREVRRPDGSTARLVVYSAPCECDGGEPTPTRVGVYVAEGPGRPALLHFSRALLVRDEPGETTTFLGADLRVVPEGFALNTHTFTFARTAIGTARRHVRFAAESTFVLEPTGPLRSAGALGPAPAREPSHWVEVPPSAVAAVVPVATRAGLTVWKAQLSPDATMTLAPTGTGWFVGPFDQVTEAQQAADAIGESLRAPGGAAAGLRVASARALQVRGPRPVILSGALSASLPRLAPFLLHWRGSIAAGDARAFSALFSGEHFHANSAGTRSDVGRVYTGAAVVTEAAEMHACLFRAQEMAAGAIVSAVESAEPYRRAFAATMQRLGVRETVQLTGLRCAPRAGEPGYPLTLLLGWDGVRWYILDAFVNG